MIKFNKKNHFYYNERGLIVPSVTQILDKVFGTGLEGAPLKFIERAAAKGSAIHEEISKYLTKSLTLDNALFEETITFIKWATKNIMDIFFGESEKILYFNSDTPFAGTCDWVHKTSLYDFKTSKTADKKQRKMWQYQLSFYFYALKKLGYKLEKMSVLHIVGNKCKEIVLEYIGDSEVEKILKTYYYADKIQDIEETKELQTVNSQQLDLFANTVKYIKELENQIKPIRESIKQEMEKRKILSLKVKDIQITYIEPTKRKTLDTDRFKKEHEDLYNAYQKESDVKSSIRIKIDE